MSLPGVYATEELNFVKKVKNEGRTILIVGNTGYKPDPNKLYTFTSKADAIQKLTQTKDNNVVKPSEKEYNAFLKVVENIFSEADAYHANHGIGLDKIYAINVGTDGLNENNVEKVLAVAEMETKIDMEVYPNLTNMNLINAVMRHLEGIKKYGDYRIALATIEQKESVDDMIKSVQIEGKSAIDSSRVVLHVNPDMIGFLAAKIACTPYYEDPAQKPYYTVRPENIKRFNRQDLEKLLDAALVAEQVVVRDGKRVVELPYIRSTSFTNNENAIDSYLYQRLNVDYQAAVTDQIAYAFLKKNNTETAKQSIEGECQTHLQKEVIAENLRNYSYSVYRKEKDPYSLVVDMAIVLPHSIHRINVNRTIQI